MCDPETSAHSELLAIHEEDLKFNMVWPEPEEVPEAHSVSNRGWPELGQQYYNLGPDQQTVRFGQLSPFQRDWKHAD